MQKYVNPFTDFGFKKLFGEELNKDLLLDFIKSVLNKETGKIIDLKYLETEHHCYTYADRRAVFDVYCENEKGEKFDIEKGKLDIARKAIKMGLSLTEISDLTGLNISEIEKLK